MSNNLSKKRAQSVNEHTVRGFYDLLEQTIDRLGLRNKPQNIYNVDETNFASSSPKTRVFARKGASNIHNLTSNNEKLNYTVQVK